MRLLHITEDGKLKFTKDFIRPEEIPPYAILSHTWGDEEVVFDDLKSLGSMEDIEANKPEGQKKIQFCAQQAKCDGLEHFWVDTCCIDKANHTELSEAINSMFRWYQNANKCYVFLSDIEGPSSENSDDLPQSWTASFSKSKWFTRGWTLQELLAPHSVEFFSRKGVLLGDKESLKQAINDITRIPVQALSGSDMSEFTVDDRFSWSQHRRTTREEDGAYCLLGLFDCHLPLIYGEGKEKAMKRLRKEVMESSGRLTKIRSWLSAPDPSTNYHKALKQRQADTGLWLLNNYDFKSWQERAASRLWLYGIPGCGKTILSSTVIEHLLQHCHDDTRKVTVYFYFNFNDVQKQNPELMLRSLLRQLLQRSVVIPDAVDASFSFCGNGNQQPSLHALLELAPQVMCLFTHVYIVLDALDECLQRSELMDMLKTVVGWRLKMVHVLMTSRKERDIEISLETYLNERETICLQSDVVNGDILRYVQQRLQDDKRLDKWNTNTDIREEIQAALMRGAQGMFRWAVCQLDTVAKCRNLAMLRKSLATLPRTLDQTYDRILTAIKEEDCIYAMRILQWLTFSARPLSIEEVAEVVAIDVERESKFDRDEVLVDPLEALDICSSLVTVTSKEIVREPPSRPLSPRDYDLDDYEEQDEERLPVFPFAHLPPPILQLPDPWERDPGDMLVNNSTRESVSMSDSQFSEMRNTDYPGWLQLEDSAIANEATFSGESTPVLEMPPSPEYLPSYEYPYYPRSSRRARLHQPTFKRIISLAHYSVQEYLMSDRIKEGPAKQYSMQEVECHKAMAKGCLAYLVQLQQLTCTGLPTSDHALALYSARFWSSHLQKSGEDTEEVSQLATDLLSTKNPAYLTWLRFGDPDDDWKADGDRGLEDVATPLYYGALLGLSTTTKLLLERGAEVNALSGRYGNALQVASVRGHEVVVQTLIDAGADINASDGRALQLAFATDHEEVIKVLIGAGADVNTPHGEYGNALQAASVKGYNTVVKQLIDRGAEINAQGGTYGNALQAASAKGHENIVRMLLDTGALVNMQGGHHNNALCAALAGAYESTASMLLKSGANVGPDNWLKGAIHYAVDNPQCTLSSFSMLQRYGAPLDTVDSQDMTPMHYCVKHSHITIMRQLTDVGVSIDSGSPQTLPTRPHTEQQATHNFRNAYAIDKMVSARENPSPSHSNRISPLHYAIKAGYQVSLKALLSMGAKVALADERGLNALHYAARSRSLAVMKAILATEEAKFVNLMTLKDKYGQGVLHHALLGYPRAEVATIQWLLDQGADSSVLDNFGTTPLSAYIKDSRWDINLEILNVLLKTESSTSASLVDYDGKTSGHLSTSASALSALGFGVLKFLYSRGVDLSQKNHEERTVIHLAAIEGTLTRESLRFLIEVIGINADEEDIHGRTALQYTIEQAAKDRNPAWESRRWEYARDVLLEYARDVSLEYQSVRRHPVLKSFVVGV